jgi:uncharacterized membrane protein YbhN (UPF0104 family)
MAPVAAGARLKAGSDGSGPPWDGGDRKREGWRRLGTWPRVGLSISLLALFVWHADWREVATILRDVHPLPLVLGLVVFAVAQVLSAVKWRWIARSLHCAANFARHIRLYFAGMFLSLFLPGFIGGDLFRAVGLSGGRSSWMPTRATLWSVFLERLTGLWGLLLLLSIGLALYPPADWLRASGILGALAVGIAPLVYGRLTRRHRSRSAPAHSPAAPFDGWHDGAVLSLSCLVQALYVCVHLLVAMALGITLGWGSWLWIAPAVGLVASLPISLGGLGPREWGYLVALEWTGLDREGAVAFAATWLLLVTVASLAGGIGLLGGPAGPLFRSHRAAAEHRPV